MSCFLFQSLCVLPLVSHDLVLRLLVIPKAQVTILYLKKNIMPMFFHAKI